MKLKMARYLNMKNNYYMLLKLKSTLRRKSIYIFMLVILLCCIIIFSSTSIYYSLSNYIVNNYNKNISFRVLNVYKDNASVDDINNINHVIDVISSKYYSVYVESNLKNSYQDGYINLIALSDKLDINLVDGNLNIDTDFNIVCPNVFFPDSSSSEFNFNNNIKTISGRDLLNKNIEIYYNSYEENTNGIRPIINNSFTDTLFVTGIYNNNVTFNNANDCYTSKNTIKIIVDNYISNDEFITYSYFVYVDDINNLDLVKDSLVSKGYTVETLNTFDEDLLNNIKIICYIFSIVSIFVALIVIVLYFRKKLENDLYDLAILRFSGLNNKLTKKCLFLENTIILSFSFIFSIVIFLIIKFMIVQKYNNYFTIYNIQFLFNRNILCIVFILIVVIPLSLLTLISNKKLNSNIDVLLRKGEL
jgi:hypothetical protein